MQKSCSWVEKGSKEKPKRGFFKFIRDIEKRCGAAGILWGNTYAFSYKKGHPRASKDFAAIEKLSGELLLAQIAILKPDIIIFAGGSASVASRRKYLGQFKRNFKNKQTYDDIKINHLITFTLDDGTLCHRIAHPRANNKGIPKAREHLLNKLLPKI